MYNTILVVSEDSELIISLRSLLEPGYRFLEAPDIEAARIKIDSEKVSMVIIDLMISPEVGPETYKEYIKALVEKDILVYLLIEERETSEEIINLTEISDDFSVKPLRSDELLSKIESLLHLKEVETKVLKQYEKLHLLGEGISGIKKSEYETELVENLRDFMLEMKAKMHKKNRELQESGRRYKNLVENVPAVIYGLAEDGTFTSLNPAFEKITGWSCSEWLGKSFNGLIHPDDLPLAIEKFQNVLKGETPIPFELRILSKSGEYLVGEISFISQSENRKVVEIFGLAHDITERKQVEEKLKTASDEWRITFDSTTDLIMLLDSEMRIIKANFATTKFLNRPFKEILGKNCFQLFHGTDRPPAVCTVKKMEMTKKHEEAKLYLSEKDIWIRISSDPVFDAKGNLIRSVHIMRDITEQKQTEERLQTYQEQLRSLASQLLLVEERERRRIATNLHDHISQTLAISKIKLGALRESTPTNLIESLDEIRDLIEQIILYTRSLTFELSPPILYDLGFEAAVEWLGEKIIKQHGIQFCFEDDKQSKPLDDEARILLFQAVRELLINIVKHAQAHNAKVSIRRDNDNIRINIEDDGVGFDTSKIDSSLRTGCLGIFSIRERLKHLGGLFEIESEPGRRTRVTIVAPLKARNIISS